MKRRNSENNFIGPVNLGNPNEISISDLASKVLELTKSNSDIIYNDLPQDDPKRRNPDISLANSKLNWNPKSDLEEGLLNTIKYFKNINEIN